MRSQFMELKVQWPLANPDIFLSDTATLSCYELRSVGTYGESGDFKSIGTSLHGRRNLHSDHKRFYVKVR